MTGFVWGLFDLSTGAALQESLAARGDEITIEQANCGSANLKGVDRLESSPIGAALFRAAEACGIQ